MRRIAPLDSDRCTATARNFPGRRETARCMRRAVIGTLCRQHARLASNTTKQAKGE